VLAGTRRQLHGIERRYARCPRARRSTGEQKRAQHEQEEKAQEPARHHRHDQSASLRGGVTGAEVSATALNARLSVAQRGLNQQRRVAA